MNRSLFALFALGLLGWSVQQVQADEIGNDSALRGSGSNDPCDLGFCDRDWYSQVGMAARRSSPDERYRSSGGVSSYNCNHTAAGGDRFIRYPFTVQDTNVLEWVRVWGFKGSNTADLSLRVYRSCMSQSEVSPTTTLLNQATITSTSGEFSTAISLVGEMPVNLNCKYFVEVQFGSNTQACATDHTNLRIYKVRVQSRRPDMIFQDRFSN